MEEEEEEERGRRLGIAVWQNGRLLLFLLLFFSLSSVGLPPPCCRLACLLAWLLGWLVGWQAEPTLFFSRTSHSCLPAQAVFPFSCLPFPLPSFHPLLSLPPPTLTPAAPLSLSSPCQKEEGGREGTQGR